MIEIELIPKLVIGWMNGWILILLLYLTYGILLKVFPKDVVARLYDYDRSGWSKPQRIFYAIGKLLAIVCLVLIVITPLKVGAIIFIPGIILFASGFVGFIIALFNFKQAPPDQPATGGLYGISRHPQVSMLFIAAIGMCIAIGSWPALLAGVISSLFLYPRDLAEEKACLERYGDSYRNYMRRVPRYLLIKTPMKEQGEDLEL